jgi:hypothetical protein
MARANRATPGLFGWWMQFMGKPCLAVDSSQADRGIIRFPESTKKEFHSRPLQGWFVP